MEDFIGIGLRISVMYLYILAMLRLTGKRSIGGMSPIDLVVAFVIGDMFDDIFWAEVPLAKGIVGLSTVIVLHTVISYFSYRSHAFERLVDGERSVLVRNGKAVEECMTKERLSDEELDALLRMQGIDDRKEIREGSLEPSGALGILQTEEAKTADRRDLKKVLERVR